MSAATRPSEMDLDIFKNLMESHRHYIERILEERDKQYEIRFQGIDQRFEEVRAAVAVAGAAQDKATIALKELNAASFTASEKAITKAEEAQRAYNAGHNDLSRKMDDQYKSMMPRTEVVAMLGAADARLDNLKTSVEKAVDIISRDISSLRESRSEGVGKGVGARENWTQIVSIISVAGVVVALIYKLVP